MKIDYSKYKNRLVEYLHLKGIQCTARHNVRCFIPGHAEKTGGKHDDNFSCAVNEDYVYCYACGQHGDVYDAVQWFENIANKKEQFNFLASVFGGEVAVSQIKQQE